VNEQEKPEPTTNPAIQAIRRHWAVKLALVLGPAIAASIGAYTTSSGESQVVKNKAEAGYQLTREDVEQLKIRVAQLEAHFEAEVAALKRAVRAGSKRVHAPSVKVVVNPPAPALPSPLPADLDKALQEVQQKAPPEPAKP
jgi:hypothetical protein